MATAPAGRPRSARRGAARTAVDQRRSPPPAGGAATRSRPPSQGCRSTGAQGLAPAAAAAWRGSAGRAGRAGPASAASSLTWRGPPSAPPSLVTSRRDPGRGAGWAAARPRALRRWAVPAATGPSTARRRGVRSPATGRWPRPFPRRGRSRALAPPPRGSLRRRAGSAPVVGRRPPPSTPGCQRPPAARRMIAPAGRFRRGPAGPDRREVGPPALGAAPAGATLPA